MSDERLYTLAEAKLEIARQECIKKGHTLKVELVHGGNDPKFVSCTRCGAEWRVVVRERVPA